MYAAEGSDWFWWYGTSLNVPGGIKPFDYAFITHLQNIYKYAKSAGGKITEKKFEPIVSLKDSEDKIKQGAMAQSRKDS